MDDIQIKRDRVKSVYPGRKWEKAVDKMPDEQVLAIYRRFVNQKKL